MNKILGKFIDYVMFIVTYSIDTIFWKTSKIYHTLIFQVVKIQKSVSNKELTITEIIKLV